MKRVDTSRSLAHVLVCTNQRTDSDLPSCADSQGFEVYDYFRDWLDERGLLTRVWLTQTHCMGWCHSDGATVAIYPDDIWYRAVTPGDCQEIIERHLRRFDGGDDGDSGSQPPTG